MQYYRYDTHVHTNEVSPCGKVPAAEVVRLYHEAGFQGIFITDHYFNGLTEKFGIWEEAAEYYLNGYRIAKEEGQKLGMDIILGMELRFDDSWRDYLIFGIDEDFVYDNPYLNRYTLASFREKFRNHNILIFQAHPFRDNLEPADAALLDGVEVFNGHPRQANYNEKAFAYGIENGLYLSAGTDAHRTQDAGRGGILITKRISSGQDIVRLYRENYPIDLMLRING
ncbi:MAG: PHP domain-containing protein [Caldicoprobacterales bacterium]|nr:PHP domain-containing protein [Clostridiales bacterium]